MLLLIPAEAGRPELKDSWVYTAKEAKWGRPSEVWSGGGRNYPSWKQTSRSCHELQWHENRVVDFALLNARHVNLGEGLVWLVVSQGGLALLLLVFSPGSTLCAEHNQAVHLMGRMWEKRDWGHSSSTPRRVGVQWPNFFPTGLKSQSFHRLLVALLPGNQAWTRGQVGRLLSGCVSYSHFPSSHHLRGPA